jgi:hypothetical protein
MTTTTPNPSVTPEIAAVLESGGRFSREQIAAYRQDPSLLPALVDSLPGRAAPHRKVAVELLVELGRGQHQPQPGWPLWPTPYVGDLRVVGALASCLGDPDGGVRDTASRVLAREVPDVAIRSFNPDIIRGLGLHPETTDAALLLGKTGASSAIELLRSTPTLRDANPENTRLALARLGDRNIETEIISEYAKAGRPSELRQRACQLGYLATPLAIITLARDLRNPSTYVWSGIASRSVRADIIECLHEALPTEPIFFPPAMPPDSDTYYATIEQWVSKNLGVTWPDPRPPFLYQEESPILP